MATYSYEALNSQGKIKKGTIESNSTDLATVELKKQGLTPVNFQEVGALNKDIKFDIGGKPKPRDLSVFCRQFVSMIRSGVAMMDALMMLSDSTENKKLKKAIYEVKLSVEKGETLSSAMAEHPKIFPSLMVSLTAAGEASGSIDVSMERMAKQLEQSNKTKSLVKKAMIYPIIVFVVAIAVVVVMLVKVIPAYSDMFAQMDTELPAITKAVKAMSEFLIDKWMIIVPVVIAAAVGIVYFSKTNTGKHFFGKITLSIPAIKTFVVKSTTAQMSRTMSTLIASGIPLVDALEIAEETMGNVYFREAIEYSRNEVMVGRPLSKPLEETGLFPPMSYYMLRIGEETGNQEEMLDKLADYYEEEVEMAVQALMAAMEPMIIIVLAVIVGFLVAACIAPMISMYAALDNL